MNEGSVPLTNQPVVFSDWIVLCRLRLASACFQKGVVWCRGPSIIGQKENL